MGVLLLASSTRELEALPLVRDRTSLYRRRPIPRGGSVKLALFLCALPSLSAAQDTTAIATPIPARLMIAPFFGYGFPSAREVNFTVTTDSGPSSGTLRLDPRGGIAAGVAVQVSLRRGIGIFGELGYTSSSAGTSTLSFGPSSDTAGAQTEAVTATGEAMSLWSARVGIALQVPVGLPLFLNFAPALVRAVPDNAPDDPLDPRRAQNQLGVSAGVDLSFPLIPAKLLLHLRAEDYVVFAKEADLTDRVNRFFAARTAGRVDAEVDPRPVNLPLVLLGVSFWF